MSLRSGKMRHRIRVELRRETPSASGEPAYVWDLFAERFASVEPLLGKEYFAAGAQADKVTTRFRIRYLAGLKPRMRIVWDGKWFDIVSIQLVNGIKHEQIVMADELVEVPLS